MWNKFALSHALCFVNKSNGTCWLKILDSSWTLSRIVVFYWINSAVVALTIDIQIQTMKTIDCACGFFGNIEESKWRRQKFWSVLIIWCLIYIWARNGVLHSFSPCEHLSDAHIWVFCHAICTMCKNVRFVRTVFGPQASTSTSTSSSSSSMCGGDHTMREARRTKSVKLVPI